MIEYLKENPSRAEVLKALRVISHHVNLLCGREFDDLKRLNNAAWLAQTHKVNDATPTVPQDGEPDRGDLSPEPTGEGAATG